MSGIGKITSRKAIYRNIGLVLKCVILRIWLCLRVKDDGWSKSRKLADVSCSSSNWYLCLFLLTPGATISIYLTTVTPPDQSWDILTSNDIVCIVVQPNMTLIRTPAIWKQFAIFISKVFITFDPILHIIKIHCIAIKVMGVSVKQPNYNLRDCWLLFHHY